MLTSLVRTISLTEIWLGSVVDNHAIAQLVPDGYKFHTVSRPAQKHGGGVAVIYKQHFTETVADHGMTQLVTDATHNKGHLLDVVIVRNHSAIVITRSSVYDELCLCDSHGNPSGDHMAIEFCVNARTPARVRKEIVFRRLRHIRLPDFKRDITSLLEDMNSDAPVSDIVATYNTGLRRIVDK